MRVLSLIVVLLGTVDNGLLLFPLITRGTFFGLPVGNMVGQVSETSVEVGAQHRDVRVHFEFEGFE